MNESANTLISQSEAAYCFSGMRFALVRELTQKRIPNPNQNRSLQTCFLSPQPITICYHHQIHNRGCIILLTTNQLCSLACGEQFTFTFYVNRERFERLIHFNIKSCMIYTVCVFCPTHTAGFNVAATGGVHKGCHVRYIQRTIWAIHLAALRRCTTCCYAQSIVLIVLGIC